MPSKVKLIKSEQDDWIVLKLNEDTLHEGHSIPDFVWLELVSNLGAYATFKTVSEEDMQEGKY